MCDVMKFPAPAWRSLGRQVRRRRVALGMSQQQLADAAGIGVNTVSNIESEDKPRRELVLADLSEALGWTRDSYLRILEGEKPEPIDPDQPAKVEAVFYERPAGLTDGDWDELKARLDADYALYKRFGRSD